MEEVFNQEKAFSERWQSVSHEILSSSNTINHNAKTYSTSHRERLVGGRQMGWEVEGRGVKWTLVKAMVSKYFMPGT